MHDDPDCLSKSVASKLNDPESCAPGIAISDKGVLAKPGSLEAMQPIHVAGWLFAQFRATAIVGRTAAVVAWGLGFVATLDVVVEQAPSKAAANNGAAHAAAKRHLLLLFTRNSFCPFRPIPLHLILHPEQSPNPVNPAARFNRSSQLSPGSTKLCAPD